MIELPSQISSKTVTAFLRELHLGHQKACYDHFIIDFKQVTSAFPNACAPLAGIIEYYTQHHNVTFESTNEPFFIPKTRILEPSTFGSDARDKAIPLSRVWKFSSSAEIHALVNAFVASVAHSAECEPGVLLGLSWCLNEVMDNVLQHSAIGHGYAMAQIHPKPKHIAICVYDYGRGIFNSLRSSQHAPKTAVDAILIAMQEGVTRDKQIGQGNGMWGLHNIVAKNSGLLNITSGSGCYGMCGGKPFTSSTVPYLSRENNCTTIDFQIDFDKVISVPTALGGHEPANLRIETLQDENQNVVYSLSEKASGTGTRQSGAALRTDVINILNETSDPVVLDFSNVAMVSSSFADEFVAKLAVKVGVATFNERIRFNGMNETVRAITDRSFAQRLGAG